MKNTSECTVYGEEQEFTSYTDCVANEDSKVFQPLLGCMVPWLSAPNQPNNCKGSFHITNITAQSFTKRIRQIWDKFLLSQDNIKNCLKPCLQLNAYSTLKRSDQISYSVVVLSIEKTVKVASYIYAYGPFDLVVDVGSSLGLWIGISAVGVFDLLLQAAQCFRKMVNI